MNRPDVIALYRTFDDSTLQRLRIAFALDLEKEADPTFCRSRIAVIDEILTGRKKHLDETPS
jgi:hypothetical protein